MTYTPDWDDADRGDFIRGNWTKTVQDAADQLNQVASAPGPSYQAPKYSPLGLLALAVAGGAANGLDKYNNPGSAMVGNYIGGANQAAQERYQSAVSAREDALKAAKTRFETAQAVSAPLLDQAGAMDKLDLSAKMHGYDQSLAGENVRYQQALQASKSDADIKMANAEHMNRLAEIHAQQDADIHRIALQFQTATAGGRWQLAYEEAMHGIQSPSAAEAQDPQFMARYRAQVHQAEHLANVFSRLTPGEAARRAHEHMYQTGQMPEDETTRWDDISRVGRNQTVLLPYRPDPRNPPKVEHAILRVAPGQFGWPPTELRPAERYVANSVR